MMAIVAVAANFVVAEAVEVSEGITVEVIHSEIIVFSVGVAFVVAVVVAVVDAVVVAVIIFG